MVLGNRSAYGPHIYINPEATYTLSSMLRLMRDSTFSKMPGMFLFLFLISLMQITRADNSIQLHYENKQVVEVRCLTNFTSYVWSELQCAIQCTQNEDCSYYQLDEMGHSDHVCILCIACIRTPGMLSDSASMPIETSQLLTGESYRIKPS